MLAASELETYRIGGQNEIANRIHVGDRIPGVVHRSALERTEPEGRAKVNATVAGLRLK